METKDDRIRMTLDEWRALNALDRANATLEDHNERLNSMGAQIEELILDHYGQRPTFWIRNDVWARVFAAAALPALIRDDDDIKHIGDLCQLALKVGREMAAMASALEKEESE